MCSEIIMAVVLVGGALIAINLICRAVMADAERNREWEAEHKKKRDAFPP